MGEDSFYEQPEMGSDWGGDFLSRCHWICHKRAAPWIKRSSRGQSHSHDNRRSTTFGKHSTQKVGALMFYVLASAPALGIVIGLIAGTLSNLARA